MLVTILTGTMIAGLLVIIALIVIRFSNRGEIGLPDQIILPQGATAVAFTQGPDWYAVVTDTDLILIYSRENGKLLQTVTVQPGN